MVLIDSSAWIEATRKDGRIEVQKAIEGLLEEYEALLCGPVEMEVLGGARKEERGRLQAYFNYIPYKRIDNKIWREAVRCNWRLRDRGVTAPWNDVLIASIALRADAKIYSIDRHFPLMAPILGFTLYEPGYGGMFNPDTE